MFIPAKIIADASNFYFITVKDHNNHVGVLSQILGVTSRGKYASQNHDVGKEKKILKNLKDKSNAFDFLDAYCNWLKVKGEIKNGQERKIGLIVNKAALDFREKSNQLKSLGLDDKSSKFLLNISPFPAHAKKCPKNGEIDDYNYELIRHHHTFNVKELVPLGWRFGRDFIKDLHNIISADMIISNIYEKILTRDFNFRIGSPDQDDFPIHDYLIEGDIIEIKDHNKKIIKKIDLKINGTQNILVEVRFYKVGASGI